MNQLVKAAPDNADKDTLANQRLLGIAGVGGAVLGGIGLVGGLGLMTLGLIE